MIIIDRISIKKYHLKYRAYGGKCWFRPHLLVDRVIFGILGAYRARFYQKFPRVGGSRMAFTPLGCSHFQVSGLDPKMISC
jgi:hypothetical protein